MGFSLIIGMLLLSILLFTTVLPGILAWIKKGNKPKPYRLSYSAVGLHIVNGIIYISGLYAVLPEPIGERLYNIIRIFLICFSLISGLREWKNNNYFAIIVFGMAFFSFIIGSFIMFIVSM